MSVSQSPGTNQPKPTLTAELNGWRIELAEPIVCHAPVHGEANDALRCIACGDDGFAIDCTCGKRLVSWR